MASTTASVAVAANGVLADAHRRGVLRQAGAVYQFRHLELQQRLANRDTGKQQDDASAAPPAAGEDAKA
jgi:hypothetical protein